MSRVGVTFNGNGEVAEYEFEPLEADLQTGLARQLARDDEIKHRLRANGKDPLRFSFEERARMQFPAKPSLNGASRNGKPSRQVLATAAVKVERSEVDWLAAGRVPRGMVTVLAGLGGLGKSQFTCLLAARNSRGELGEVAATLILLRR
jgi:AAA domain